MNTTSDINLPVPKLEDLLKKYQNPKEVSSFYSLRRHFILKPRLQADTVSKIQEDLGKTKSTIIDSMQLLLERGENLDELMKKSENLSLQSRIILDLSKDMNRSCCPIL